MSLFKILREREITRAEEIRILHNKHNVSVEKLAEDLLYDREWCRKQGIRYYDLKPPNVEISSWEIAKNFVVNAIKNEQEQAEPYC